MKNIILLSVITIILITISCNKDEPTPFVPDCDSIYPAYESIISDYQPTLEWCAVGNNEKYRFQLSKDIHFVDLLFDTISESNIITPLYLIPTSVPNAFDSKILVWGTKYYWRVAAIEYSIQKSWSDTYVFETNDMRDEIVGTYTAKKTEIRRISTLYSIYLDSVHSEHQILVEKIPNSRGINIKDLSLSNFDLAVYESRTNDYSWWDSYNGPYINAQFKIDVDSFAIKYYSCSPCSGFLYSGRK
jgi:hypothetical protein